MNQSMRLWNWNGVKFKLQVTAKGDTYLTSLEKNQRPVLSSPAGSTSLTKLLRPARKTNIYWIYYLKVLGDIQVIYVNYYGCMYVFIDALRYVSMYTTSCMYVSICIFTCMDVCMYEYILCMSRLHVLRSVCTYVCMYVGMYVWMDGQMSRWKYFSV